MLFRSGNTASTYNINVPTVNGDMVTTGDTATVTSAMISGPVTIAKGGTNQTTFTAPSGNVKGLVFFDGTSLATDATVTDVGYDTSTNTVRANNLYVGGTVSLAGSTGTSGYVLTSNGASAPTWQAASSGITTGKSIAMAMIFGF